MPGVMPPYLNRCRFGVLTADWLDEIEEEKKRKERELREDWERGRPEGGGVKAGGRRAALPTHTSRDHARLPVSLLPGPAEMFRPGISLTK